MAPPPPESAFGPRPAGPAPSGVANRPAEPDRLRGTPDAEPARPGPGAVTGRPAEAGRPALVADDPRRLLSRPLLRFFLPLLRRRLQSSFHAVRIVDTGVPAVDPALPLVLCCNHPSWWDAALLLVLCRHLWPARQAYGPIDAEALQRYRFMRRIGLFGVSADHRGAATFLRVGRALLADPAALLCVTPEATFTDPRQRPLLLRPGLAALLARTPQVTVLPLALEYPFWSERTPEALGCFGQPLVLGAASGQSADAIQELLQTALTAAMDRLAAEATSRDPGRFHTVFSGRAGVGGVYDQWRRIAARLRGESFDPAHVPEAPARRARP